MKEDCSRTDWLPHPTPLDFQSRQVDVWRITLDLPPATVKFLESTLLEDEAQRAGRFHFEKDKSSYIIAHGCLRDILSRYLRCEPRELSFDIDEYGKPSIKGHKLEFNLSHSGDFALIAVSRERKVGVDVERIRSDLELESMASRFFSPTEVSELAALPPKQRKLAFFNCWTRKEAYIKAQGLGLSLPLDSFDVSLTPNEPAILRATRPDAQEASCWTLFSLEVAHNYAAALAVEGRGLKLRLWDWNTSI
jgi:4'-phosphopantetheinyl transferase